MINPPLTKIEVTNQNPNLDWKFGEQETNIALANLKLGVRISRYQIVAANGKQLYDTISIEEPQTNSVAVIQNENSEIGLIREWRPIPERWFWACVRGYGDPEDEDELATAKREMLEEIGECRIIESKKIGMIYQNTAYYRYPVGLILIRVEQEASHNQVDEGIIDFRFFTTNEIKKMIESEEIADTFTMTALTRFLLSI